MKKQNSLLILLLSAALAMQTLAGCARSASSTVQETSVTQASTEKETEASEESSLSESQTSESAVATTREITDMAGRTVTIPNQIESAYSANPVATIMLYMVSPKHLLGWNYKLNETEKAYILEEYHSKPNFGMGDAVNYETIIAENPSIAIFVGKINDSIASECDALSDKLGVPVLAVDGDLKNSAAAFRFMGDVFGVKEHAEELAAYAEKTLEDAKKSAEIPQEQKVRLYYGNGAESLETAPAGSFNAMIFDLVNVINVADVESKDGSRVQISAEQLLAWDPDMIVVNGEPKSSLSGADAAAAILGNSNYADLKAVKVKQVYGIPNAPFGWIERPQGPNRLIGVRWLFATAYPDTAAYDLREEVKEFFKLFYHTDLTAEQVDDLLHIVR